jgi:outer membrane protein assembly factor BamB
VSINQDYYWTVGEVGPIWLVSGLIAMIGTAAAVGQFPPDSLERLLGSPFLFMSAGFLYSFSRMDLFGNAPPVWKRGLVVAPAACAGVWYTVHFLLRRTLGQIAIRRTAVVAFAACLLLLMVGLVFVSPNYLQPAVGMQRALLCLDLETGAIIWDQPLFMAPLETKYHLNSYATPTPCTDGQVVIAHFGTGTACVDFSGRVLWTVVDPDFPATTVYGASSSPIMVGDTVIVVQESEKYLGHHPDRARRPSSIIAYDRLSGQMRWRIDPEYAHDSYGTPLLLHRTGVTELVTATWESVVSYDVESGKRLWTHKTPLQQSVASMVSNEGLLCVGGGVNGPNACMMLRLNDTSCHSEPELLWQTEKRTHECASPVLYKGRLYGITNDGFMVCFDALTGRICWRERLKGRYYASLVAADDKVYASSEAGVITAVAADARFKVLGQSELAEAVYASPALSDGTILLRTKNSLFCIKKN